MTARAHSHTRAHTHSTHDTHTHSMDIHSKPRAFFTSYSYTKLTFLQNYNKKISRAGRLIDFGR